jgi:hypothetical protein
LFAQQIGDDLNPTVQVLIDKANELLASFWDWTRASAWRSSSSPQSRRRSVPQYWLSVRWSAASASVSGFCSRQQGIGKFSGAVKLAGGGIGGFVKTLASSKLVIAALAAAVVYGAYSGTITRRCEDARAALKA